MNIRIARLIFFVCAIAALIIPMRTNAQSGKGKHHHYKLVEPATLGGPGSRINGFLYSTFSSVQVLNNAGTLTGWADTSMQDPYQFSGNQYGNFCFEGDCYVTHAFRLQNGVITDLGALPGGLNSATSWISANGLIAGTSQNGETDPLNPGFPENRAVLWRGGKIIDLGTLSEGGYESGAQAVNSSGQVVGWALNTVSDPYSMFLWSTLYNYYNPITSYQSRAFLWQNGVMKDLGTLGTGTNAYAMAINEQGQVIGISYTNSTPNGITTPCSTGPIPTQDPFLWENGKMIDLGTLGGTCGFPSWINNYGQVVGSSDLAEDLTQHAFLWTRFKGMKDLGTLGGSSSNASMINDSGLAVGGSQLEGDTQFDAFLWDGKMRDLGTLDGANCAYAFSVNAQEQVVGNSGAGCANSAFLWEDGGPMVDLSTLISPNPGFPQLNVISINDRGEIAGIGVDASDNTHSVLLIPCDEYHPGIEGCDYSLVDAAAAAEVQPPQITTEAASASSQTMPFPVGMTTRVRLPWRGHGTPKPATHFSVSAPATAAIGSAFSFTVTAVSSSNTVATGYTGTAHFTSSDGQAVLPANSTLTNGVGNFSATLNTAGAQTISATDAATPSITGTSSSINVSSNQQSQLEITSSEPPSGTVGSSYDLRDVPCKRGDSRCVCIIIVGIGRECFGVLSGFVLAADGGTQPYTWTWSAAANSSLPPGLSLPQGQAVISGTPTVAGVYNVVVTVTDSESPAVHVSANYTINIAANPSQVTVTISASSRARPPVEPPQPVTLTWSSTNATSCAASANPSASDWSGPEPTSGSAVVSPVPVGTSTIYTLTCTGPTGNTSASVTVSTPCVVGPCRG
jgi:probable HAF family extracellular repeat protein